MDERVIRRLIARLGAEFGHKFTSAMPTAEAREAAVAVWAERLAGLSNDELRRGVDALSSYARRNDGWPPGASEFRELCRPHREPYERVEFQQRALPNNQRTLTAAENRERVGSLRAALRGEYPGGAA